MNIYIFSCKVLEISRETLVQPQIFPPQRADEISKPLMGDLVRYHVYYALFRGGARQTAIVQYVPLLVCQQAPILHCARHEVGQRHHVQFRQLIRDAQRPLEEFDEAVHHGQGISSVLDRVPPCPNAKNAVVQPREVGNDQGEQVRRHFRRFLETDFSPFAPAHNIINFQSRVWIIARFIEW